MIFKNEIWVAKVVVNDLGGSVDGSGSANSPADDVVDEIVKNGGEAVANYDSVATKEGGEAIVQSALDNYGTVDAVINNAGILRDKSFANMSEDELSLILDVHLKGTFFVTQPAFKVMKENNYGRIVNVASNAHIGAEIDYENINAEKSFSAWTSYCVSKLMNIMITYKMAAMQDKVSVNVLHPGFVDTNHC